MYSTTRKFNQKLYDQCDMTAKLASIQLMKSKGYELADDINKEHYKKFDLIFINTDGNIIKVENEYRGNYSKIKNIFKTVHIPIRKRESQCDYYFVWGNDYQEVGIIKMEDISKFKNTPVKVLCTQAMEKYDADAYEEYFIDVPKSYVNFFKINNNGVWKKN